MNAPSVGASIAAITFGMAGVVYTEPAGTRARDESWLTAGFRMTPWTARYEWRSTDMTVVAHQHAHEARTRPGSYQLRVPQVGELQGIAFGQFFDVPDPTPDPVSFSESILSAYGSHGVSSFRSLNGLWAAVIWDGAGRRALFARDCVGGQTLYAAQLDGRIVFATDLRAFHASGMLRALDEEAVAQFLHYLYVPAPRTLVAGCTAVLPGHVLSIGDSTRHEKYATPRFVNGPTIENADELERETERHLPAFEDRLLTAVADCVPEHGRVALALSGGKDSSVLAIALSKVCPGRVLAFTVGQSDERLDESHHAALVCDALGLAHQRYVPTDDELAHGIVDFARVQDQPIGDTAALPYFLGMSQLPEDCTVVIDGTGNDYYFGIPGTSKGLWRYKRRADLQAVAGPLWPALLGAMALGPLGARRLSEYWRRPVEETFVAWDGWSSADLAQLFGRDVSFAETYLWRLMQGADPADWLNVHTEVVCGVWEPHAAYRKAIHFAQAVGRSIRFPFTDNRLAAFVQGLPEQLKYRDGVNKQILRAYMKQCLPREIVQKPKSGFIFDLNRLFANPAFAWHEELDRAGLLRALPTWSQAPIAELLQRRKAAPDDPRWQQRLYALCLMATVLAVKEGYDPFRETTPCRSNSSRS
ncbi:MAG: asparagine synthase-related protein [Steroidobacteraceae bacterium]